MEILEPITREEKFMAAAAGDTTEKLTPITRKEKFLARIAENAGNGSGGGNTGGGAQADFLANEGEAGHILNRTHWKEEVEAEIIPQTTFALAPHQLGCTVAEISPFALEEGKTYTVIFDGNTYTCTAMTGTLDTYSFIGIGNPYFAGGEGNGMPFSISVINDIMYWVMGTDTNEHSVRVIGEKTVYHKLNEEYLTKSDFMVAFSVYAEGNGVLDTPWEDIIAAAEAKKNIYGVMRRATPIYDQYENLKGYHYESQYFICNLVENHSETLECKAIFISLYGYKVVTWTRDENGVTTVTVEQ